MKRMNVFEKTFSYLMLTLIGIALASPFIYMVSIALASDATTTKASFTLLPREFEWENFVRVFTHKNMGTYLYNSVVITALVIVGTVASSSLVAYGFARLNGFGNRFWFLVLLSTMMLPGEVTMIPQFIIFRHLGWINTYLPLTVPSFFGGAFNVFLIRQFIMRISRDYDEAAQIDGLGVFGIYLRVIIPLIFPILTAVAIFAFAWSWGNYMGPLIYINKESLMPLALGVQLITATAHTGMTPPWNLVMVASMFLTIPMVLVYFFGQKYIYEANISGGSAGIK